MWVTTRSLAKEIQMNQREFNKKFEEVDEQQKSSFYSIEEALISINKKIEEILKSNDAFKSQCQENYCFLLEHLLKLQNNVDVLEERYITKTSEIVDTIKREFVGVDNNITSIADKIGEMEKCTLPLMKSDITSRTDYIGELIGANGKNIVAGLKKIDSMNDVTDEMNTGIMRIEEKTMAIEKLCVAVDNKLQNETENLNVRFQALNETIEKSNQEVVSEIKDNLAINIRSDYEKILQSHLVLNDGLVSILKSEDLLNEKLECAVVSSDKTKKEISLLGEKNDAILEKMDHDQKCTQQQINTLINQTEVSNQVIGEKIKKYFKNQSMEFVERIDLIKDEINKELKKVETHENIVNDNLENMGLAMQEILRNLMALDEGSRLIIAKLLLGEMDD